MIKDEVFELLPMDSVWGMHNWPGTKVGQAAEHAGPIIAGADVLYSPLSLTSANRFFNKLNRLRGLRPVLLDAMPAGGVRFSFSPNIDNKDGVGFAQALISEFFGPEGIDFDISSSSGAEDFSYLIQGKVKRMHLAWCKYGIRETSQPFL